MIARPWLTGALGLTLAAPLPLLAAEGGVIRGGEHADFSRIVMTVEPTTEWSLESGEGSVTIRFPSRALAFDTGEVFARMPTTRIRKVSVAAEGGGTVVRVELGCDCRVSTAFVGAQYLALDVGERGFAPPPPPPAAETAEAREVRETAAVRSAEEVLIAQIERAAGQGLVQLSAPPGAPPPAAPTGQVALRAPAPPPRPSAAMAEAGAQAGAEHAAEAEAPPAASEKVGLAALFRDQEQIEATTVYDRDSAKARANAAAAAVPVACLPDEVLDVAAWGGSRPFPTELALLRRGLVGEFDDPRPEAVIELARLYVRYGFGAEARATLVAFDPMATADETPVLADLARVVDGEPAAESGPLALAGSCPGLHGLWLALGGRASAFIDAGQFAAVHATFEGLPLDLRILVGPGLVLRLVDAGRPAEARVILDTILRAGVSSAEPLPAVAVAAGRVLAAEGRTEEAIRTLLSVAESGGPLAAEGLAALVETALAAHIAVPDRTILDLRAAALLNRGAAAEPGLRALLAEALAARAELPAAIAETRAAMADLPAAADAFGSIAVASLGAADPAAVGNAAYADTVLSAEDLLAGAPARDPARRSVAKHLVALGLPAPALAVLAPAIVLDDPAARLIAAEAEIGLGDGPAARATLGALAGPEAAVLTARAFMLEGNYSAAVAALKAAGLDAEAAAYAWPSGDWAAVDATDPERAAMAGYMQARRGEAAESVAPDTPGAAFQAPLPSLERPSLRAARELLSSAPGIGGVIGGVIGADAAKPGH